MIVLAAAAEVMAPAEAFQALTRVLSVIGRGGPTTAPLHWQADFSKDEKAWIAAAALAGAAGTAGVVARDLLAYATSDRLADIASDTVIAKIIRRIEWADMDSELRERWLSLASTQARNHPISPTAAAIRNVLSVDSELSVGDDDASLNDLAERINHYLRTEQPIPACDRRQSAPHCRAWRRLRRRRRRGRSLGESYDLPRSSQFSSPNRQMKTHGLEFLANPLVARSEFAHLRHPSS